MEWQPIETVPKTEFGQEEINRVMFWVPKSGFRSSGQHVFGYACRSTKTGEEFINLDGHSGDWKVTHWMPLPEPPK